MASRRGLLTIAGLMAFGVAQTSSATTFVIDAEQSFVTASYSIWTATPILDLGTLMPTGMVEWRPERVEERFMLSGTLDVTRTPAIYLDNAARISIDQNNLVSDVPASVGFSLSSMLLQFGSTVEFQSDPCFGNGFDLPPNMTSWCSGWTVAGYGSASEGSLEDGVLTLTGYRQNGFVILPDRLVMPDGSLPPTIGGDFDGAYTFELRAVALVPEPASMAMMLMGVGVIGAVVRRNRSGSNGQIR